MSGATNDFGAGAQLSALIHSSPVAIYSTSVDGTVTTWNRGAERTFGWTAEEVIGKPLPIMPSEQTNQAAKLVRDLLRGGSITDVEQERIRKDGTRIIVSLSAGPVFDARGALTGMIVVSVDMTERKRAEAELRASEASLRMAQRVAHLGSWELDPRTGQGRWSDEMFTLLRLSREKGTPRLEEFYALSHPDDLAQMKEAEARILRGDTDTEEFEYRSHPDLGPIRHFSAHLELFRDSEGRPAKLVGTLLDITARWETEERLHISQRLEALGRLAGGVAHDFNNLLTAIISYSDLALGAIGPESRGWKEVQQIRRAGMRAAELTRQLLAFGRSQVMQPRRVSLNDVLIGMRSMLERILPEVELVLELAPDLGKVRADPGQLEQVIVNLVVNARDATPQGGRITISTRNAQASPESLDGPELVELTITDTGAGMDVETMSHVFEPFFSTKQPGRGTGLGLSIVYGIVEQSGGSVSVRSRPGEGATFTIHLPKEADGSRESILPPGQPVDRTAGSETVLLVDDDAAVLGVAERILVALGYKVLSAAGPEAALVVCKEHPGDIDVLLTDVVMPGMRGPELASQCVNLRPSLVVVFMSGYADGLSSEKPLLALSRIAPISKPFSAGELATKIRTALDTRNQAP